MMIEKLIKRIGIVAVLALLLFLVSIPIQNDRQAVAIAKDLRQIPLPEKTEYIERVSRAGKLTGNGNGMQYLGAILLKSELSLEQLSAYYDTYAEYEWEYMVERQHGQELQMVEHDIVSFDTEITGDTYYVVYSWGEGDGFFSHLDLRGH